MKEALSEKNIDFTYVDIFKNPIELKKFLKLRDVEPEFAEARTEHYVGIPCLVKDGEIFLPETTEEAIEFINK